MSTEALEQLIEEPWNGGDLLPPLSDAERTAIRAGLLARVESDGDQMDTGVPAALAWFADAEVLATLKRVVASNVRGVVAEEAASSIGVIAKTLPAAQAVLRELLTHEDSGVVRMAVEHIDDGALVLPLIDALAAHANDTLMASVIAKLAETPTPQVIEAIARHWDFAIVHNKTSSASNKIFDTLIDHAPHSKVAQAVFATAVAHADEYAQVRGLAALALTSDDITPHVKKLKTMKGLKPSGSSLRKSALTKLVKNRKADLERLAAAGDKTAASLLK